MIPEPAAEAETAADFNPAAIRQQINRLAHQAGFDLVAVADAAEFAADREAALRRIHDGLLDGLPWFTKDRVRRGANPQELLPGARSIIALGLNYYSNSDSESESDTDAASDSDSRPAPGLVARYAPRPRLPPPDETPDAPPGHRPLRNYRSPVRRPLVCGRRADAGPRRRRPRRPGLVRQKRQHPQPRLRLLAAAGADYHRPALDARCPPAENLRRLRPLYPRLPHRCHHRPLCGGQPPLHQLPDY